MAPSTRGVRHGYASCLETLGAEVTASSAAWREDLLARRFEPAAQGFTPDGQWLRSGAAPLQAPGPRIVELECSSATVDGAGQQATQSSRYRQVLPWPDGCLQTASGRFDARWAYAAGGRWRLARLQQVSAEPLSS